MEELDGLRKDAIDDGKEPLYIIDTAVDGRRYILVEADLVWDYLNES